jgi:hypothetical protein
MEALLAYSFSVDRTTRTVMLRAIFDQAPSDQDSACIWELEGAIGVHFPDEWRVSTNFEILPPAQEPDLGNDEVLHRRGAAMTPRQRWQHRHAGDGA